MGFSLYLYFIYYLTDKEFKYSYFIYTCNPRLILPFNIILSILNGKIIHVIHMRFMLILGYEFIIFYSRNKNINILYNVLDFKLNLTIFILYLLLIN